MERTANIDLREVAGGTVCADVHCTTKCSGRPDDPREAISVSDQVSGVITGGGSGIGAATARRFASIGASVAVADISSNAAEEIAAELSTSGGNAVGYGADIRDAAAMDMLVQRVVDTFGSLDFVVACAGAVNQGTVAEGDPDAWRRVIDTNVTGTMLTVRAALPHMIRQGSGHIVLVASMSGRDVHSGEPAYIASKWGEVGFGHALRLEVEPMNIRVTLIEPGLVDTPFISGNPRATRMKDLIKPLSADDVARTILFAFQQPPHVGITEIAIRPVGQSAAARSAPSAAATS
jgi:NADP-dependent 3-hydroxy acid dehydrogenase YdfG